MNLLLAANENIPLRSIRKLRESGFDVLSVSEDYSGVSDNKVLSVAKDENRILLTFDRDYGELIFRNRMPVPPAVVYLRFIPVSPDETAEILRKLLMAEGASLAGRYWVIARNGIRSRKLPSPLGTGQ